MEGESLACRARLAAQCLVAEGSEQCRSRPRFSGASDDVGRRPSALDPGERGTTQRMPSEGLEPIAGIVESLEQFVDRPPLGQERLWENLADDHRPMPAQNINGTVQHDAFVAL